MKKFFIALFFILGSFIAKESFAQSGSGSFSIPYNVVSAPTVSLSASPATVASGGSSTLSWSVSNATSCTASGGWTGSKSVSGGSENRTNITSSTTYTLTCTGSGGSASSSATVTVASGPTVSLSASPTSVASGGSSTLTWNTTNATSCTASGGWSGSKSVGSNRTENRTGLTSTTTYTLTCTGPGGSASDSATVTVASGPTVSLSASPTSVASGGSSTLSWSVSNATSCTASGGWTGSKSVSGGSENRTNITSNTTYTLTCTGPGGSASDSATVGITASVPTVSLTANPSTVVSGGGTTLTLSTTNATSCTASGAWSGSKPVNGNTWVSGITSNRTYSVTCYSSSGGSASASAYVTVGSGPSAPTGFNVYQDDPFCHSQNPYAFVRLSWNPVAGATSYTLRNSSGTVIGNTSLTTIYYQTYIPPSMQITFSVTANNASGSSPEISATGTFVDNNCPAQSLNLNVTSGYQCGTTSTSISWSNPSSSFVELTRNGSIIYSGYGSSVSDSGLSSGQYYTYTLYIGVNSESVGISLPAACAVDMCLNIAGTQATVPSGYFRHGENCYVNGDMCINIEGTQASIPEGMRQDASTLQCLPQNDVTIIEF